MGFSNNNGSISVEKPSMWHSLVNHPTGFWFIFWGEFAERCSYYGMRAILVTYMVSQLGMTQAEGIRYVSLFIAGCYLLPLVGGFVADNFLGKYNTIVLFSIPYILGHVILGIEDRFAMFIALALLAMGSGVIKPNISTLMGLTYDQYRPGQEQLRSNAFAIFYMSINIGAAISQLAIPYIRSNYSYQLAFLFPAVLMGLAFILFAIGKPFYAKEIISRAHASPEERALRWKVLGQIGGLFLLVVPFWAIFDQSASTWILFAQDHMNLELFGYHIDPEQVQAVNPILIVALLPLVTLLWTALSTRGIKVRATDKMIVGFLLTAGCMGVMAYAGFVTAPEAKVSVGWQILAYVFITVAEILISVTGLELAFVAAPKTMKSFVTSLWLLTVFVANFFLNAPLGEVYPRMEPGNYFAMLSGLMLGVTVCFFFVARWFNRQIDQEQEQEAMRARALAALQDESDVYPGTTPTGVQPGLPPGGPSTGVRPASE